MPYVFKYEYKKYKKSYKYQNIDLLSNQWRKGGVEITFILYLFPGMSGFHIVMQDTDSTNRQIPRTIEYIVLPPEKNKTLEIMIA